MCRAQQTPNSAQVWCAIAQVGLGHQDGVNPIATGTLRAYTRIKTKPRGAREVGDLTVDPNWGPDVTSLLYPRCGPLWRHANKDLTMRILSLIFLTFATGASAHPGHIVDVAGHGHWVGAAAIGLAILVGLWGKAKGREATDEEGEAEIEEEEATA